MNDLAEAMAGASFTLLTGLMVTLVEKGIVSKEDVAEVIDQGMLHLEESGLTNEMQRAVHDTLHELLGLFRSPGPPG